MTLLVEKLETLDKNNVLSIRREIAVLKNKLKECEASKSENIPVRPPPPAPGKHVAFLPLEPGHKGPCRVAVRVNETTLEELRAL